MLAEHRNVVPVCLPSSCGSTCQQGDQIININWGVVQNTNQPSALIEKRYLQMYSLQTCRQVYGSSIADSRTICTSTESSVCDVIDGGQLALCQRSGSYVVDALSAFATCGWNQRTSSTPLIFNRICDVTNWIETNTY